MKLKQNLLIALLLSTLIIPTASAQTDQPVRDIRETFTQANMSKIMSGYHEHTYMIAADNTVYAYGNNVLGTLDKSKWSKVVLDNSGTPLSDIVEVSGVSSRGFAFFLDAYGHVYKLTNSFPEKLNLPDKVKSIAGTSKSSALGLVYVSEDGTLKSYDVSNNKSITLNTKLTNIKSIETTHVTSSDMAVIVLTESGEVYIVGHNSPTVTKVPNISNVVEALPYGYDVIVRFENGSCGIVTHSGVFTPIILQEGELAIDLINKLGYYSGPAITTTKGSYNLVNGKLVKLNATPVAVSETFWLDSDLNFHEKNNAIYLDTELTLGIEDNLNSNPVVLEYYLANFDILTDSIQDRTGECTIEFNLVRNNPPTAFNIYFSKARTISSRDTWQTIATNVSVDDLNKVVYDTGSVDGSGNPITGYTYTYNWKYGNENLDLSQIQIIVEPVN